MVLDRLGTSIVFRADVRQQSIIASVSTYTSSISLSPGADQFNFFRQP